MPWPRRYLSSLAEFFRGFYFGVLSDILFCVALGAISGAEIFGFFAELGFVWTAPMDSGRGKFFSVALFLVVSGRLGSGPVFLSISGISISAFLFGILFNGTCHAKTAPEKFCCLSILGFLVCWSSVRRFFLRYPEFRFSPFVRKSF